MSGLDPKPLGSGGEGKIVEYTGGSFRNSAGEIIPTLRELGDEDVRLQFAVSLAETNLAHAKSALQMHRNRGKKA